MMINTMPGKNAVKKIINSDVFIYFAVTILSIICAYFLTKRYFPIEPDAANSPLVWREMLENGFSVIKYWKPTPDNWYFTVYPINFFFFFVLSDDGKIPLIISTSLFVSLSAIIITWILNSTNKSKASFLAMSALIFLPAYVYTFGFIAHPFSHNSTNFFGIFTFALCFYNIKKSSTRITILYSLIALLSAVSDPWFLATYFLPILLVQIYFSWKEKSNWKNTVIFGITFILAMTHVIPRILGLPVQHFKLAPFDLWAENAAWMVKIIGRSMNIFFIDAQIAYVSSFIVWSLIVIYSIYDCLQRGKESTFIAIFSALTIAGIISSFIISYTTPADISARFFINAICFSFVIGALCFSYKRNILIVLAFTLFVFSSLYSYTVIKSPLYDQEKQTLSYIDFLKEHKLFFGYSDYWLSSNTVNWLSNNEIHISPVLFDKKTYRIQFDEVRSQTFSTWLTPTYFEKAPQRQFISIPAIQNSQPDSEMNRRLDAIKQQVGIPDEVLTYEDKTLFIYNSKITIP
ncbi:hypothetical protein M2403_001465 [Rahnella sp. BIGb0603]|uniref:hypothetical protein n=1 Tax=Rahnella sp. BIGb0603 TaxID=2940612 RepID=UPI002167B5A7|nr:hypothetical protein [Rahnella sp. BIGb0603]MCS3422865.1 hypothetical protein [Rahnella sp. BIGb0603]